MDHPLGGVFVQVTEPSTNLVSGDRILAVNGHGLLAVSKVGDGPDITTAEGNHCLFILLIL